GSDCEWAVDRALREGTQSVQAWVPTQSVGTRGQGALRAGTQSVRAGVPTQSVGTRGQRKERWAGARSARLSHPTLPSIASRAGGGGVLRRFWPRGCRGGRG